MKDPEEFRAPFIPKERIWQEAEKLRAAYPAGRAVPVPVLELAEFDLGFKTFQFVPHALTGGVAAARRAAVRKLVPRRRFAEI